jgi:hypothetical protein
MPKRSNLRKYSLEDEKLVKIDLHDNSHKNVNLDTDFVNSTDTPVTITTKNIKSSRKRKRVDYKEVSSESEQDITSESEDEFVSLETSDIWKNFSYDKNDFSNLKKKIKKYSNKKSSSKRPKKKAKNNNEKIDNKMLCWISATRAKNYLLDDPCLDWLNIWFHKYGLTDIDTDSDKINNNNLIKDTSHLEVLFDGGNRFEEKVFEELKKLYDDDFQIVFDQDDYQVFKKERDMNGFIRTKYNETIKLMKKGTPFIAQAVMINDSNMTYGVADILIRSDYMSDIFGIFYDDGKLEAPAPKIGLEKYHYRVIDCKWTTLTLNVDGYTVRNSGFIPAYKGQLAIYNACLDQMQGYIPDSAYIMGKAWKIGKQDILKEEERKYKGFSAYDRLGVVNYVNKDKNYVTKTKEAIQWVQRVMTEGREWRYGLNKPSIPELYPNMNKNHDQSFISVKKELAERYGEITQAWYVGPKHRANANKYGITDIRDPRISLEKLGIKSEKRGHVIKQILNINKSNQTKYLVKPKRIKTNDMNWQEDHIMDYYVDFETMNYNLFVDPKYMNTDNSFFDDSVTFMIGIGFLHEPEVDSMKIIEALEMDKSRCDAFHKIDDKKYKKVGKWEFVCFYITDLQVCNELELYRLFFQFMIVRNCIIKKLYGYEDESSENESRVFHWTSAELQFMDRAVKRMRSNQYDNDLAEMFNIDNNTKEIKKIKSELKNLIKTFENTVIWVDLCTEMRKEPVVVKGCYKYALKNFANAMQKNGLILTNWDNGKMSNGFTAMIEAIKIYRNGRNLAEQGKFKESIVNIDNNDFNEIVKYNEVDCRVMWEIIVYLRENHV